MSDPAQHHKINYIEFASTDIAQTKEFYTNGLRLEFYGLRSGLCEL